VRWSLCLGELTGGGEKYPPNEGPELKLEFVWSGLAQAEACGSSEKRRKFVFWMWGVGV
jgi:hypothetical protein